VGGHGNWPLGLRTQSVAKIRSTSQLRMLPIRLLALTVGTFHLSHSTLDLDFISRWWFQGCKCRALGSPGARKLAIKVAGPPANTRDRREVTPRDAT
jgi:hypothetical protein